MSECVVSTSVARANRVGFRRCDTKNFCYYPPPPPPTESGRLLEITENVCYYPPPPQSVVVPLLDYQLRIRPCVQY